MPTPYAVGPVNAYLVEEDPPTLIDAGINTQAGRDAMLDGLAQDGFDVKDLERILITHAHPDHYGLVHFLQDLSGATVYFPDREIARVRDRQMVFEVGRLLVRAGMPLELLFKMDEQRRSGPRPERLKHDDVVAVRDGDRISFGPEDAPTFYLDAYLMPGHTGGHVVYFDPVSRSLFAGDQLLPDTSPNPLLEPSLDEPGERRRSLEEYLRSLDAMAAMGPAVAYPGHGEVIEEPERLIRQTIDHHARRKADVAARLDEDGKTPYELATEMYPNVQGYDTFLSVSEVIAHLDLIVSDGGAAIQERDGVTYYVSTRS